MNVEVGRNFSKVKEKIDNNLSIGTTCMGRRVKFILIIKALNIFLKELNMMQGRPLELIKDYDCTINYHPRKANVVAESLSFIKKKLIEAFEHLKLEVKISGKGMR